VKSGEIKLFTGILVVALALVGVAVIPTILNSNNRQRNLVVTPVPGLTREALVPTGSRELGNKSAPFILVEFGDYECPLCKTESKTVAEILSKYKDKLKLVYHHCQMSNAHKNSATLAMAAYAAEQQGKFWQMHDKLFESQDAFRVGTKEQVLDTLTTLATDLKLDVLKFRSDIVTESARKSVLNEQEMATRAKVQGTPFFFFISPAGQVKSVPQTMLKQWLENPANWK
jgi:protein-disulfide isomerase